MKVGATEFVRTKSLFLNAVSYIDKNNELSLALAEPSGITVDIRALEITNEKELEELAKLISEVWSDHLHLRIRSNKTIVSTLSGH